MKIKFVNNNLFKGLHLLVLFVSAFVMCVADADAQGVRIYKTDGKVIDVMHSELDSIVLAPQEENNRVYRTDGTVFKVLFSETDSIVAFSGIDATANFVDLGLSVMWAVHNVGAEKPEEYGDYFAWGEISPKSVYTKENSLTYGKHVIAISGYDEYDAARAIIGGSARIPTMEEYNELLNKCIWEWTTVNGVDGQRITGPNGNSIFMPAAGFRRDSLLNDAGVKGVYWSSSPYEGDNTSAYNHLFNDSGYWGSMRSRYDGLTVRPVLGSIKCVPSTGDTVRVGETSAEVSLSFAYVPSGGVVGGVEYSSTNTGKQRKTVEVNKDGEYVITLNGLERGAKYRYRAFIILNDHYIYGAMEEFVTNNSEDNLTKGEWIDLGLSVKWASHNVGALKPEDNGSYFAWGELYPKKMYDKNNCETSGKSIPDISGNSEYDAATANWGGDARMPTEKEIDELIEKCKWEWIPRNGVNGMLVTGPNGNSIFIPAAGLRLGPALEYEEINGFVWGSAPSATDDNRSYGILFSKNGQRGTWSNRSDGRSIRPVSK